MNANEFDLDFDFEKEYGFDLPKEEENTPPKEDFDLKAILESDFAEEADLFHAEYDNDFDYGPEETPVENEPVIPEDEIDVPVFETEEPSIEQLLMEDDIPGYGRNIQYIHIIIQLYI